MAEMAVYGNVMVIDKPADFVITSSNYQPTLPGKRPAGSYLVAGPIKTVTDDVVTVQAGREKIDVPFTPETELLVNTQDCSIVEPGDKVTVEGQYYRRGELQATVMTITRLNPLMPPPKKGPRRPGKAAP